MAEPSTPVEERIRRALAEEAGSLSEDESEALQRRLVSLVEAQVQGERERCVTACRRRAELWSKALEERQESGPEEAREEARARQNEATYLADLLASGESLAPEVGKGEFLM